MTAEAAFSSTAKDSRGNLHTIRGDNFDEFSGNVHRALGEQAGANYLATFTSAFGGSAEGVALANVQAVYPGAVAAPPSTVGQPLPQPGAVAQPQPAQAPPGGPGNCAHGAPYVYMETPGKGGAPWRRYECSVPWSRDAVGRCANVKV